MGGAYCSRIVASRLLVLHICIRLLASSSWCSIASGGSSGRLSIWGWLFMVQPAARPGACVIGSLIGVQLMSTICSSLR
ncbi:hypothetical protein V8C86DRAFT_2551583 [Haematococcus lacustris]